MWQPVSSLSGFCPIWASSTKPLAGLGLIWVPGSLAGAMFFGHFIAPLLGRAGFTAGPARPLFFQQKGILP